jgi:hypothetical protein
MICLKLIIMLNVLMTLHPTKLVELETLLAPTHLNKLVKTPTKPIFDIYKFHGLHTLILPTLIFGI